MKGVRIINVSIDGQHFPVSPPIVKNLEKNFFTVIIGNNAAGKSRFLVNVLNAFRQARNQRLKSKDLKINVNLLINGKPKTIENKQFYTNIEIEKEINLLSISNSLFDKFPQQAKSDKNYAYVGSRMTGISTHKRAIVNDLMDIFSTNLQDKSFVLKAKQLFDFLKIDPVIKISLKNSFTSSQSNFNGKIFDNINSIEGLKNHLLDISKQGFYRQQANVIERFANNDEFIFGFYEYLINNKIENTNSSSKRTRYFEINISDETNNLKFVEEYAYISLLRRLNVLTYEYIKLRKGNLDYDILDSSTGEIGLLITFLRAIPELKSNTIIFIDEPEISLHPSWQMRYIDLLKSFLKGFTGCHVLIATHSHFLLSDLKETFGSVVVLNNKNGNFTAELKEYTPFGWSPEAILYDVFGVVNVRNHYFEYDLRKLLSMISTRSKDFKKINDYITKFKQFQYINGDPLHQIIKEAEKYVEEKK
ncbi:AAA family ATPase [Aquirufa sp. Wall-65K1]